MFYSATNIDLNTEDENQKFLTNGPNGCGKIGREYKSTDLESRNKVSILRPLIEVFGSYFLLGFVLKLLHATSYFTSPQILKYVQQILVVSVVFKI